MQTNTVTIKSFKTLKLTKDQNDLKIDFLDDNKKKCTISLSCFNRLCDLRPRIVSLATILRDDEVLPEGSGASTFLTHESRSALKCDKEKCSSPNTLLESVFKVEYAKALIANLPAVQRFRFSGCQMNTQHDCISASTEEKICMWFEDLLAMVDESRVVEQYCLYTEFLDCVDRKDLEEFKSNLLDFEWLINMKTENWKLKLKEAAVRLELESRFHE